MHQSFTVGVEEEYQIIDPETRSLRQRAEVILSRTEDSPVNAEAELQLSQIEIGTPVCDTLAQVRAELARSRRAVGAAAAKEGLCIGAAGSHPLADPTDQTITPKERYLGMAEDYGGWPANKSSSATTCMWGSRIARLPYKP